jgi:hypothetical protein
MNTKKIIIIASLCWGGLGMADSISNLELAQQAYLKGNFTKMAVLLRGVLSENPPVSVQQNALALLSSAYEVSEGKIGADWKLPTEIKKLKVVQKRVERDGKTTFSLKIAGNTISKGLIKQLQLVKYPNQVVLDKQGKVGEYSELAETNPADGIYFEVDGENEEVPVAEGLYLINIELANGSKTNGWVILSDVVSSRSPDVYEPKSGAVITTPNPVFQYEDFVSPEYKKTEHRSIWMGIFDVLDPNWKDVWSLYDGALPKTSVTVGKEPDQEGVSELKPGKYHFYLAYKEERRFGEVRLGRMSVRTVPFSVK